MTPIRELLAPIRELETAATEGPWRWTDLGSQTRQELRNAERPLLRCSALMHPEPADAAFIAAARTDVPRLVAAIEAVAGMHYESVAYADDVAEGGDDPVPDDYERHYCNEDGETWPCATVRAVVAALESEA